MEILARREFLMRKTEILNKIKAGNIFIYPTDTIYGIGCNALLTNSVKEIRLIKNRPKSPFSIIVPSKQWIFDNCILTNHQKQEIETKLPGPYTFIIKLNNKCEISKNINPKDNTIGLRIPDHYITNIVKELGVPIVTTSANKHGEKFMTSIENLDSDIENEVEFMIYDGEKTAKPSKIINFVTKEVIER